MSTARTAAAQAASVAARKAESLRRLALAEKIITDGAPVWRAARAVGWALSTLNQMRRKYATKAPEPRSKRPGEPCPHGCATATVTRESATDTRGRKVWRYYCPACETRYRTVDGAVELMGEDDPWAATWERRVRELRASGITKENAEDQATREAYRRMTA